ncbi:MAG: TolC family protein [Phascolarctobacterium sp.]|nr:TolC family protein [Phascolarctobacterium sp.]
MSVNKMSKKLLVLSAALTMFMAQAAYAETVHMDLPDAMQRAFDTNPDISIAQYNFEAARANYNAARESYGISITASHQTSRSGYDDPYYNNYGVWTKDIGNYHSNGVTASMPIFTGGKLEGATKQAKAAYKIAKVGVQQSYNDMRDTVTTGYFNVLNARNMRQLTSESVDRLSDHLKNVQAQYDVGVVAKVDVLRSEVEVASAVQSWLSAKNSAEIAEANLNRIVGLPLDTSLELDDLLNYTPCDYDLPYCLDYSVKHRPEYEIAKQYVEAAKGALISAKSGHMPQISASATQKWADKNWPGDDNGNWAVGLSASLNVFDTGVTWSKIHAAEADLHKAEENYRSTVDQLNLDVRTKYYNMRVAEEQIRSAKSALDAAEEDYRIAKLRYMNGVGTNTDVLDAQVALTNAKTNYLQAMYDYNVSKVELDNAIGVPMVRPVKVVPAKETDKK